jgi:hypothetical protein
MLVRAAFWCFYAAWQQEQVAKDYGTMIGTATLPTEARHDGHQLRAVTQTLALRDCILIERTTLEHLNAHVGVARRLSVVTATMWLSAAFVAGMLLMWLLTW